MPVQGGRTWITGAPEPHLLHQLPSLRGHDVHYAMMDRDQTLLHRVRRVLLPARRRRHRDDPVRTPIRGPRDGNRVEDPAVHQVHPVHLRGRVEQRQCARCVHRLRQRHVRPAPGPEPHRVARLQVHRVDAQRDLQLRPLTARQDPVDILPERLTPEHRLLPHPVRQQRPPVDVHDVPLDQRPRSRFQQSHRRTPRDGRAHQCPDARPHDLRHPDPHLPQRLPRSHVRDPLHSPATQDQGRSLGARHARNVHPRHPPRKVAPSARRTARRGLRGIRGPGIVETENHYS
jgi:hypothetical protein